MPKRRIILTKSDFDRLETLLSSEFTLAIGPSEYLEGLAGELQRAEVVEPERVPRNVVTMNSTVKLRDCETDELESYTLVFPEQADIANQKLSVLAPWERLFWDNAWATRCAGAPLAGGDGLESKTYYTSQNGLEC